MYRLFRLSAIAAALAMVAAQAAAHHVWIEQDGQGARLHFGEFADNVREVSPGLLDKFMQARAKLVSADGEQALTVQKTSAAFAIPATAGKGESIVAEADYPAYDKKDAGQTLRGVWIPAARYVADFSAQTPTLVLDVVPTGKEGEFQIFYRGQPLPEVSVSAIAASGWSRDGQTDAQGRVSFNLPWQGAYGIEVKHNDKTPGERAGEKYDIASYVTTLSFVQPDGLVSPPAPIVQAKAESNQ
jgi:uncharacterized GH25 family protein